MDWVQGLSVLLKEGSATTAFLAGMLSGAISVCWFLWRWVKPADWTHKDQVQKFADMQVQTLAAMKGLLQMHVEKGGS